uniref:Uncharacterized protein n=1 Tax=Arundo donax TaxID=35708 RepID=A0A0A8Z9S4_ARUDO
MVRLHTTTSYDLMMQVSLPLIQPTIVSSSGWSILTEVTTLFLLHGL